VSEGEKDEAIVLHSRAYAEVDAIISLFARKHGRISVYARGARSSKRKNAPPFAPLWEITLELHKKTGSTLYAPRAVSLTSAHDPLMRDLMRLAAANCAVELVRELFEEGQSDSDVYDRLREVLCVLESAPPLETMDDFEHELLAALGYQQQEAGASPAARFRARTAIFEHIRGRTLPARAFLTSL
jgi:DNA repair protein RecO